MHFPELQNGQYHTAPEKISLLSRLLPSFVFYPQFLGVVANASRKAKQGKYPDSEWAKDSLRVLRLLEKAGLKISISGLHNIADIGSPCVFIGNHMSIMETLILPVIIIRHVKVTFVIKESLLTYPVFKHIMISRNPVAVTRTNPRKDLKTVMTEGVDRLKNGTSIIVFPQTTRSTDFDAEHFGSIGTKLAKKADVPIVPFALKTDAWQNGKYSKDFGRLIPAKPVKIAFGKPLRINGKGNEEHLQVIDFISEKLNKWQ